MTHTALESTSATDGAAVAVANSREDEQIGPASFNSAFHVIYWATNQRFKGADSSTP